MMCSWAACHKPAAGIVDDWPMCQRHLAMHHEMAFEALLSPDEVEMDELIRLRWRQGRTDGEIALEVGIYPEQVLWRRRAMKLTNSRRARCGTRPGYLRHRADSETPCSECKHAQCLYDAERYASKGRRAA